MKDVFKLAFGIALGIMLADTVGQLVIKFFYSTFFRF